MLVIVRHPAYLNEIFYRQNYRRCRMNSPERAGCQMDLGLKDQQNQKCWLHRYGNACWLQGLECPHLRTAEYRVLHTIHVAPSKRLLTSAGRTIMQP